MADQSFIDGLTPFAATAGFAGIEALAAETAAAIGKEAGAMGGGKYSFSPDELHAVLQKWQRLSDTVTKAQAAAARNVTGTPAPAGKPMGGGNEVASQTASNAVQTTQTAYSDYLNSMQTYITGYVQKLNDALARYTGVEQNAASAAQQIHGEMA